MELSSRSGKSTNASREFSLLSWLLCYTTGSLSNSANYRPHQELAPLVPISSVFSPSLPSLSVSPCFSSRRGFPSNSPRFLDMSLSTVRPVPSFHRHRLLLYPSLSVTFNSDPTIPPSPSLSLLLVATPLTSLFPPTSVPVLSFLLLVTLSFYIYPRSLPIPYIYFFLSFFRPRAVTISSSLFSFSSLLR